jgi:outer membrane immunogenic protein
MRKSSLTLLAAVFGLAASQASAADLPRKAPPAPPPPPPLTWTGCYIGANVGGAWGRFTLEGPFGGEVDRSTNNASFVGGGQIGCDYQFAGGWVIGFRNMFDGTTNSRDRTFEVTGPGIDVVGTSEFRMRWFDALTGRIGYSWQPNSLLYFQGGAVWSRLEADLALTTTVGPVTTVTSGSASTTKTGWTIGGGWEYRFAPQWSVFIEGNYYDFGTRDRTIFSPVGTACDFGCTFSRKATAATALIGVNYRFGGFGAGL